MIDFISDFLLFACLCVLTLIVHLTLIFHQWADIQTEYRKIGQRWATLDSIKE